MRCIYCHDVGTRVVDSTPLDDRVTRRRKCRTCLRSFTTHEQSIDKPTPLARLEQLSWEEAEEAIRKAWER